MGGGIEGRLKEGLLQVMDGGRQLAENQMGRSWSLGLSWLNHLNHHRLRHHARGGVRFEGLGDLGWRSAPEIST